MFFLFFFRKKLLVYMIVQMRILLQLFVKLFEMFASILNTETKKSLFNVDDICFFAQVTRRHMLSLL